VTPLSLLSLPPSPWSLSALLRPGVHAGSRRHCVPLHLQAPRDPQPSEHLDVVRGKGLHGVGSNQLAEMKLEDTEQAALCVPILLAGAFFQEE
jgi:hypothetical protein